MHESNVRSTLHALSILGKLQRIEAKVSGLTVHLANPGIVGEELALNDHGKRRDLSNAEAYNALRIVIALLQGLSPRCLWVSINVERTLGKDADNCQHGTAAVLQLGFSEPLHVWPSHVAVEVKVAIVELAAAKGILPISLPVSTSGPVMVKQAL